MIVPEIIELLYLYSGRKNLPSECVGSVLGGAGESLEHGSVSLGWDIAEIIRNLLSLESS